jgi:hypothetical protein
MTGTPSGTPIETVPNGQAIDLPPDPEAFDSPRAERARARGLAAPYIPGGADPDAEAGKREERRYLWLLVALIVAVVLGAFVLGWVETLFAR